MRIGVIGLGFMGSTHVQAIRKIPGARLAAVLDKNEQRLSGDLSGVTGNLGIDGVKMDFSDVAKYSELDAFLSDESMEAVDICVPTHLHESFVTAALARGKHVLVEKPMALNAESAGRMLEAARRSGKILMVAQVLRFMEEYKFLCGLVRSGRLGTVRSAMFRRRTAVPEWGPWEFDKSKSGGGVFDLLIHDVDMALHLFGEPRRVTASGYENLQGGLDLISAKFTYEKGPAVTVTGGWHHRGQYPFSMEYTVAGDHGVVEFSSAGRPPAVYWADGRSEAMEAQAADPYKAEIEYFLECCAQGRQPELCPPKESAAAVRVACDMVRAREAGAA